MHCRFVIHGGWERSIDVSKQTLSSYGSVPPERWRITEPPKPQPVFGSERASFPMETVTERIFRRVEIRDPKNPLASEFFFAEIGSGADFYPDEYQKHECAALARAYHRIAELEVLVDRAATFMRENEMPIVAGLVFAGDRPTRGQALDDTEALKDQLTDVARKARAEGRIR